MLSCVARSGEIARQDAAVGEVLRGEVPFAGDDEWLEQPFGQRLTFSPDRFDGKRLAVERSVV